MAEGLVFDIQPFAIHDGPGIRTTVFVKGCPLRCLWCHNPESQQPGAEIFYAPEKCIACRACQQICEQGAHRFDGERHTYQRELCTACGACAHTCYARALEVSGQPVGVEAVLEQVLKDRDFFQTSGGGLTISGGEPLQQFEFTRALLIAAKGAGLHTCLETSGCASPGHLLDLVPLVDLFLYDDKESDPHLHWQYTGASQQPILENLLALDRAGARIILRCPIIPGLNDRSDHFAGIAATARRLAHLEEIHLLPYHPLGTSKNQRLGKTQPLPAVPSPDEAQVEGWVRAVQANSPVPVRKG